MQRRTRWPALVAPALLLMAACGSGGGAAPPAAASPTVPAGVCSHLVDVVRGQPGWSAAAPGQPDWAMSAPPASASPSAATTAFCDVEASGGRRLTVAIGSAGDDPVATTAAVCASMRQAFPGQHSETGDTTCHLRPTDPSAATASSVTVIGDHLVTLVVDDPADSTALASAFLSAVSFGLQGQLG